RPGLDCLVSVREPAVGPDVHCGQRVCLRRLAGDDAALPLDWLGHDKAGFDLEGVAFGHEVGEGRPLESDAVAAEVARDLLEDGWEEGRQLVRPSLELN